MHTKVVYRLMKATNEKKHIMDPTNCWPRKHLSGTETIFYCSGLKIEKSSDVWRFMSSKYDAKSTGKMLRNLGKIFRLELQDLCSPRSRVVKYLPKDMASHSGRLDSSSTQLWEIPISSRDLLKILAIEDVGPDILVFVNLLVEVYKEKLFESHSAC
jgi:hypothetical protein